MAKWKQITLWTLFLIFIVVTGDVWIEVIEWFFTRFIALLFIVIFTIVAIVAVYYGIQYYKDNKTPKSRYGYGYQPRQRRRYKNNW